MQIKTSCNRDCPDACGIIATVEEGRVVKLQGDPDHPVTQGFLCYRTSRFLERQYDESRITEPLFREGSEFRPVSWDEALDRIAKTMLRIRDESGPAAILNYRSGGSMGMMKALTDYFFECFGPVAIKSGDICSGAGEAAQETDFGDADSNDLHDLLNSKTIFIWGKNPFTSNVHLLPVLRQARSRGARLVQIDPVHHRGAELCDHYFQSRPGGDLALAMGIARVLFERGAVDLRAAEYCDHYEEFRDRCLSKELWEWAELADLTPDEIKELAVLYGTGPSAILVGWGMQRRAQGSATVRALDALGAISGNVGIPGGGVSFYFKRRGAFEMDFVGALEVAPRSIPEPLLGPGILEASDPPIRMVWVHNGNPVAMLPESGTVARALESRELTVVVDGFITDTARSADIVLPTTTMLEDEDLIGAYGHHYLGNVRQVVPPPEGVRTDYEIVQALAPRVGLDLQETGLNRAPREWKERFLSRVAKRGVTVAALEQGPLKNPESVSVLYADRKFSTASGRVNLIHDVECTPPRTTAERPLLLMPLSTPKAQSSQWPSRKQEGPATVTVHPEAAKGFAHLETVWLESDSGSMQVKLWFDERQRRDVVLMDKGGWMSRGRCANRLIRAKATDAGGGACFYDTPVRLTRDAPEVG